MKEEIDWKTLAEKIETLDENGKRVPAFDSYRAIEILIGEDNLRKAVDYYISGQSGSELTRSVLWQIQPWSAMKYCYEIYKSGRDTEERRLAVILLVSIADRRALNWINEFLDDEDEFIQGSGISIVAELRLSGWINFEDCEDLLLKAESHANSNVREQAEFIRGIHLN